MGRRKILISISDDLDREFRSFLVRKYGEYQKGLLSYEIEQALRAWMANHAAHTNAQIEPHVSPPNPEPRIQRIWEQVRAYLAKEFFQETGLVPGAQVPKWMLERAIAAVRGTDRRTIRKWLREFERWHLIKWISPYVVEVI